MLIVTVPLEAGGADTYTLTGPSPDLGVDVIWVWRTLGLRGCKGMPFMVKFLNITYNLATSFYDQIAIRVTGFRKAVPGFRVHAANAANDVIVITQIWDNCQNHRDSFGSAVKPDIPARGVVRDPSDRTGQYYRRVRRPLPVRRRQHGERDD
jgi:hypothetical protein